MVQIGQGPNSQILRMFRSKTLRFALTPKTHQKFILPQIICIDHLMADNHSLEKVNPDTNNLPNQAARAMAIATNDTQRIFIAYDQPDWYYTQSKLFSSPDGGTTWIHLNDIIPAITDFGITNIEVSPTNADSILVSLGGFMSQWSPKSRVLLSVDGGHNWKDYSKGLPNMPVNCLKYKKGSQGGIFAGTDVGVFYIDRTIADTTWVE